MNELPELLDHYFSLGVAEGKEGRDHDTPAGEAQATRDLIDQKIQRLERALSNVGRIATDRLYMMQAYHSMLGPIGLEVAKMWSDAGVTRQHTSWGPEASALTGEERAQVLLDAGLAPRQAQGGEE